MLQARLSFEGPVEEGPAQATVSNNLARHGHRFRDNALLVREVEGGYRQANEQEVIAAARQVLATRMREGTMVMDSPDTVKAYLGVQMGMLEYEVFSVVFVDAQHRLIETREMFRGTLTQTAVYPREVVKAALAVNAVAVILAHNHPSGSTEPSRADEGLTQVLKQALALVDVKVLDHFIIAGDRVTSFAQRGLL